MREKVTENGEERKFLIDHILTIKKVKLDVISLSWKEECKGDGFPHQSCWKKKVETYTNFLDSI